MIIFVAFIMKIQSFYLTLAVLNYFLFISFFVSCDLAYINQWAVQIDGNEESAQEVADRLGYVIIDKVWIIL